MNANTLPQPGYSIAETEKILCLPRRTAYRLIRERELESFLDSTGAMRVSREELYRFIKERDK